MIQLLIRCPDDMKRVSDLGHVFQHGAVEHFAVRSGEIQYPVLDPTTPVGRLGVEPALDLDRRCGGNEVDELAGVDIDNRGCPLFATEPAFADKQCFV